MEVSKTLSGLAQRLNLLNIQLVAGSCETELTTVAVDVSRLRERLMDCRLNIAAELERLSQAKETCAALLSAIERHAGVRFATKPRPDNVLSTNSSTASIPTIEEISDEEFVTIPKYMKGRLTREKINAGVDFVNKVTSEKYTLLRQNPSKLNDLRDSECDEMAGKHFVTEGDMKVVMAAAGKGNGVAFKLDSTGRAILAILRHLGRLKEIRAAGITRFIVY